MSVIGLRIRFSTRLSTSITPHFLALMEQQGRSIPLRSIPLYVQSEFDDYLQCGRLEHGFLRVRCEDCHHERLVAFSCTNSRRFRRAPRDLSQLWRQTDGRRLHGCKR